MVVRLMPREVAFSRPTRRKGRLLMRTGYYRIWAPEHPLADAHGYVLEHRKVAWDAGILTDPSHAVHHINGTKTDNRPENLAAMPKREHTREHVREKGLVTNQFGTFPVLYGEARIERDRARQRRRYWARKEAASCPP